MFPGTIGVFYDFRNPAPWREPWDVRYRKTLEQIDWVESHAAFGAVSLSEHHFVDDGYTPSVLTLAGAVAARTRQVQIATNILQLPLHHPLRVAEDALTVDALCGGRFRLGVGVGYREEEFTAFGTRTRDRGARMEEGLAILRAAFDGEPVRHGGTHWQLPEVRVTPGPIRDGGPGLWVGGSAPAAIRRAARWGDGFMAAALDADVLAFREACTQLGQGRKPAMKTAWMVVAEDPERELDRVGGHMLHQVNEYIEYGFLPGPRYTDPRAVIDAGFYTVTDAEGARTILHQAGEAGVDEMHFFGMLPGEDVDAGTARLEYLAAKVLAHP